MEGKNQVILQWATVKLPVVSNPAGGDFIKGSETVLTTLNWSIYTYFP